MVLSTVKQTNKQNVYIHGNINIALQCSYCTHNFGSSSDIPKFLREKSLVQSHTTWWASLHTVTE